MPGKNPIALCTRYQPNFLSLLLLLLIVLGMGRETHAQSYSADSLAVRAILDINGLDSIPVEAVTPERAGRIQILAFSHRPVTTLPKELGVLTELTQLYVDSTGLTALPTEIGELTKLQVLFMGGNQLTGLPASIGNLKKLTTLTLENNKLTSLPSEIGGLDSLSVLNLPHNSLTSLPTAITGLPKLQALVVSHNQLSALPEAIGDMSGLLLLNLQNNGLENLPENIVKLKAEKVLLGGNKLCNLSEIIKAWATQVDSNWEAGQSCNGTAIRTSPAKTIRNGTHEPGRIVDARGKTLGYYLTDAILEEPYNPSRNFRIPSFSK